MSDFCFNLSFLGPLALSDPTNQTCLNSLTFTDLQHVTLTLTLSLVLTITYPILEPPQTYPTIHAWIILSELKYASIVLTLTQRLTYWTFLTNFGKF